MQVGGGYAPWSGWATSGRLALGLGSTPDKRAPRVLPIKRAQRTFRTGQFQINFHSKGSETTVDPLAMRLLVQQRLERRVRSRLTRTVGPLFA